MAPSQHLAEVVARFGVAVVAVDHFVVVVVAIGDLDLFGDGQIRKRNLNWKRENPIRSVGKPGNKIVISYRYGNKLS